MPDPHPEDKALLDLCSIYRKALHDASLREFPDGKGGRNHVIVAIAVILVEVFTRSYPEYSYDKLEELLANLWQTAGKLPACTGVFCSCQNEHKDLNDMMTHDTKGDDGTIKESHPMGDCPDCAGSDRFKDGETVRVISCPTPGLVGKTGIVTSRQFDTRMVEIDGEDCWLAETQLEEVKESL